APLVRVRVGLCLKCPGLRLAHRRERRLGLVDRVLDLARQRHPDEVEPEILEEVTTEAVADVTGETVVDGLLHAGDIAVVLRPRRGGTDLVGGRRRAFVLY